MDLFLFPNSYCDVASMADVVRLTSGNLYKYSYFQVSQHVTVFNKESSVEVAVSKLGNLSTIG